MVCLAQELPLPEYLERWVSPDLKPVTSILPLLCTVNLHSKGLKNVNFTSVTFIAYNKQVRLHFI